MKQTTTKTIYTLLSVLVALCMAALFAPAAHAAGESASVTGAEYYGTDYIQFNIAGSGDTTFFDLQYGDTYKIRRAQCQFVEGVNTVGWEIADGEDPLAYTLTVYTGRTAQTGTVLATGSVVGVYADLFSDQGCTAQTGSVLIGLRTMGSDAFSFTVPATYYDTASGGDYNLVGPGAAQGHYNYAPYVAAGLTGSVSFVGAEGKVLQTVPLPGITTTSEVTYQIPASLEVGGTTYYPTYTGTLTAAYTGQIDYTILCRPMRTAGEGAFKATITMVDETGKVLMTDNVNVTRVYTYTAPQTFVVTGQGTATAYTALPGEQTTFTMRPGDTVQQYTITYAGQQDGTDAQWNIIKMNGSTGARLGVETVTVAPGETATYTPAAETVDGATYTPVGSASYTYTYGGANLVQYIYYVPAGYVPETSYNITLQYISYGSGQVIYSEQIAVQPGADTVLNSPAAYNGYVRLAGQPDTTRHSYYSPKRTYSFYYRGADETLYANTVINTTQTITTTRTQETVQYVSDGATVVGGGDGAPTYVAGPGADEELTAATDDTTGAGQLLNEEGEDLADVREDVILDNETPLAQGETTPQDTADQDPAAAAAASEQGGIGSTIALAAALLLGVLLLVLIAYQLRKNRNARH